MHHSKTIMVIFFYVDIDKNKNKIGWSWKILQSSFTLLCTIIHSIIFLTLHNICMLTNYIFMVPIKTKTTEDVINAYLKYVYSAFGHSKYILSDRWGEFSSNQFTSLGKKLGFTKVHTSPYTQTENSVIKGTHSFLKASLWKIISNHNTDWDNIDCIAAIVYHLFPHSSSGETPFYLCSDEMLICPLCSKYCYLKLYTQKV